MSVPLYGAQYFARLTQRLISALTAQTNYGVLYQVDMRLRPSGRAGPLATQIDGFASYQENEAWTWEHMALTRARVVSASAGLRGAGRGGDPRCPHARTRCESRRADAVEMRGAIAKEKGDDDRWDLKYVAGGLIDIEFIAQYLQLVHAAATPDILDTSTARVLDKAWRLGLLSTADAEVLRPAVRLYHDLTQILRLCLQVPSTPRRRRPVSQGCSRAPPTCPISRRSMRFLPRRKRRCAGCSCEFSGRRREGGYFNSNSTMLIGVLPMFLTARVTPGSCQKNSPLRSAHPRSAAPGHDLADLASVNDDPHAGRALRDGGDRLARFEHEPPSAHAFVVDDLLIAGDIGARAGREPPGLGIKERHHNVVERRRTDILPAMRLRLFGECGVADIAARTAPRWRQFSAEHLIGHVCRCDIHADLVARVGVIDLRPARRAGRQVDAQQHHQIIVKDRPVVGRLLDRHRIFTLGAGRLRDRNRAHHERRCQQMSHGMPPSHVLAPRDL